MPTPPDPTGSETLATGPAGEQLYYSPPSWYSRHIGPWVLFLPISALLVSLWLDGPHSLLAHIAFALVELLFIAVLRSVLRDKSIPCFTIGPNYVRLEESGQTKTLLFKEIKGFSECSSKNSTYTLIEPLDPKNPSLSFDKEFANYQLLRQQLARYVPDLDAAEQERHNQALAATTALLLQNPTLGLNPRARQAVLTRAKKATRWLTLAAFPLAGWALFSAVPYEVVIALNLAVPLLAIGTLWRYRGAVGLVVGSDDPRPEVALAVGVPSLAAAWGSAAGFALLQWAPVWLPAFSAALCFLVLLLGSGWPGGQLVKRVAAVVAGALLASVAYGFAVAMAYNCAFGGNHTTTYAARITDRTKYVGKNVTCYLDVKPWGPPDAPTSFKVSEQRYDAKKVGDTLLVHWHEGRLGASWVGVAD